MNISRPSPLTREFAIGAIARLQARRTGRASFDAWIDYAIRQWEGFLAETSNLPDDFDAERVALARAFFGRPR